MRSEPVSGRARCTARHMATIPYPASSAPSLALYARMVQSKAQSLPCLSHPSLSLLRLSGLCSPPKCSTSLALPVPSFLVLASPCCMILRRHAAHCTFGGGLPCGSTLRRPALASAPARCGQLAQLWGTFLFLSHVRSFMPPWHTMRIRWSASSTPPSLPCHLSDHLPFSQREHGAEQFPRQRSLTPPLLCPGPLALSCPLSARPLSPCPAPRPWLQGLWPPVSPSPSSLYPLRLHHAEQCARQPSHSLSSLLLPGVLSSWQVARTLYRTRYLRGQAA